MSILKDAIQTIGLDEGKYRFLIKKAEKAYGQDSDLVKSIWEMQQHLIRLPRMALYIAQGGYPREEFSRRETCRNAALFVTQAFSIRTICQS